MTETIDVTTVQASSSQPSLPIRVPVIESLWSLYVVESSIGIDVEMSLPTGTMLAEVKSYRPIYPEPESEGRGTLVVVEGLVRALEARLYDEADGAVVIEDIATGIFGMGDSLPDAVYDFREALQAHLAALADEPVLAPNLEHQRTLLRSYFNIA
ncbi:MAG TPA: hypothetical protein VN840_16165 [Streptosporangiaceae bacterium]|nr:hypothetical protein [Streptosporangiaceae bacterium]